MPDAHPDATADSDAALVARALINDDPAFALLMSRHKHWVHRFIKRYVGAGNDEAYDLLQETFFSAWLALTRYQPELPFAAWLRQIALNKCRDRSRRNKVRRFLLGQPAEDAVVPEAHDPSPGPETIARDEQEYALIERHVNDLPRSLKEPLLLAALEGLSHQEVAAMLGISTKAVEMRIYRAREKLTGLR